MLKILFSVAIHHYYQYNIYFWSSLSLTAITHTVLELSQYRIIGAPFASYSDPFYGFSEKSLFMPDSPGTFMKASLEMHALNTSPSERFHTASDLAWRCKSTNK